MIVSELKRRVLNRVGDDPSAAPSLMHYTPSEVVTALNQSQRIFVFFSLCLETTATLAIASNTTRYAMLSFFGDWIAPLRIRIQSGAKLKPCRLTNLAALNESWSGTTGTPERYALSGFDLLAIYKQATGTLEVTYARGPSAMILDADSPEIPTRYQPALIDGAVALLRVKEGIQEWQKELPRWGRFLDAIQDCAEKVRARNREQGYDTLPVELKRFDRSHVLQKAG